MFKDGSVEIMFKRKWLRWMLAASLILIVLGGAGFILWAENTPQPGLDAVRALQSSSAVRISVNGSLQFQPKRDDINTGFILYPGGRVRAESYAVLCHRIASKGYLVVVPRMPLHLAVFDIDAAEGVMRAHPDIDQWVIGGHSLGGAMAAAFAERQPTSLKGLILWAAFPGDNTDLRESGLEVLSIYGTRDGLATPEEITGGADQLPEDTRWVEIKGGNHAGFGSYGCQRGDLSATISLESQQRIIVRATSDFLGNFQK
ncbi:MAG: alpha/beta fold hydrolase [Anaerolineales bacterium]